MKTRVVFGKGVALGIALGAIGIVAVLSVGSRAAPSFTKTPLFGTELTGIPSVELLVSRLETAPGWVHGLLVRIHPRNQPMSIELP